MRLLAGVLTAVAMVASPTFAAQSDRDFTGKWIYHAAGSRPGDLTVLPEPYFQVQQTDAAVRVASEIAGAPAQWHYALDGAETKYKAGAETRNSAVKWEGAALLINTLVSGSRNYVIMDRWRLAADPDTLMVTRQVMQGQQQSEGVLMYRRDGRPLPPPESRQPESRPSELPRPTPPAGALRPRPVEPAPEDAAVVVRAGTRILLRMLNTVDTKHSKDGDRVYLETEVPVTVEGRVVIPRGSQVTAVITNAKQPGRVKGKGELYLRFDSLTLPNGVTRDFRSRLSGADAGVSGDLDRKEGKITSPGNKSGDARTVAGGAGVGAGAGGLAGAIGGNAGMGTGIGAAAGAAAGLAKVLGRRGPDASIPRGATVEMLLDRDISFQAADIRF